MITIICPKCGIENSANAMNCKNCRINLKFALEHPELFQGATQETTPSEQASQEKTLCALLGHNFTKHQYRKRSNEKCELLAICERCGFRKSEWLGAHEYGSQSAVSPKCEEYLACQKCGGWKKIGISHDFKKIETPCEVYEQCARCGVRTKSEFSHDFRRIETPCKVYEQCTRCGFAHTIEERHEYELVSYEEQQMGLDAHYEEEYVCKVCGKHEGRSGFRFHDG
jgi:hypothetical protein